MDGINSVLEQARYTISKSLIPCSDDSLIILRISDLNAVNYIIQNSH